MAKESKYYELAYVASPTLSDEAVLEFQESLRTILGAHEVDIESWDAPRRRLLAYPVQNEREGFAGAFRFHASPSKIISLQKKTREHKNMLRSILLEWRKNPPRPAFASRPMRAKEEQVPTDEKALDAKLEQILGATPNESQ